MSEERRMIRRQWVRRLTDPDEPLTLDEFKAVPAAFLLRELTVGEFIAPLEAAFENSRPMTLLEVLVLTLAHTRENVKDARMGTQHLEGMVGTLDEFLARMNPETYGLLAAKRARPTPMLPEQEGS